MELKISSKFQRCDIYIILLTNFCSLHSSVNEKYNKSGIHSNINHLQTSVTTTTSKLDSNEPPTKLIKLINGSAILAPMDKDKMLHSGQLTLSQVRNFVKTN